MLKIAFQCEPISEMNQAKSGTYALLDAAVRAGHAVYQYSPDTLRYSQGAVLAEVVEVSSFLRKQESGTKNGDPRLRGDDEERVTKSLAEMNVVLIRQDPPFDMRYITTTYLLELLPKSVRVINNPKSVRDFAEKVSPIQLKQFTPRTVIGEYVPAFQDFFKLEGKIILKPLYLFGGNDVFLCETAEQVVEKAKYLIEKTGCGVVGQQYIPEVKQGDKRIVLLNGEVVGCFLRVPEAGKVAANLMQGGTLAKAEMTENDKAICAALKPLLLRHDIPICGIDVIGKFLTEINVTAPMGFKQINDLYGLDVCKDFWEKFV